MAYLGEPRRLELPRDEVRLQSWLAQEEAERDHARYALERLRRTVDAYRERLLSLRLKPGEAKHARELLREMEVEVAAARTQATPLPALNNYEVLSRSLKETQRQCESVNLEMVQQAGDHEKLVESMGSVKAANKGLLEQIRTQQDDLSQLTQQCVACEERVEQLRRRQDLEHERQRQEALAEVAALRETWAQRSGEVRQQGTAQLRSVQLKAVALQSGAQQLQAELQARREDLRALSGEVAAWMAVWKEDLPARFLEPLRKQKEIRDQVEHSIGQLRSLLSQERQERQQESLQWAKKYGELQTDKEDLQARITRECAQLESRLQALEKRQLEDHQSWIEERTRLEQRCGELQQQLESCQAQREGQRGQLEAEALRVRATEIQSLEKLLSELQRQRREAQDALASAVLSNDHLREQLREQQIRLEEESGKDLLERQAPLQERFAEVTRQAEAEIALSTRQMEAMVAEVRECDQELVRLLNDQEALSGELLRVEGDVAQWRSALDSENSNREVLEKELNAARHLFNAEQLTLQSQCDGLNVSIEDLEQEIRMLSDDVVQKRRLLMSRQGEHSTRQAAAEAHLQESQELLALCQSRLREAAEQRARALSEGEGQRLKSIEIIAVLERNVEQQVQVLEDIRSRYGAVLENERRLHDQAKQECEREMELSSSLTRQAQRDSRLRLQGMERERFRVEERSREDLLQSHEYVVKLQQLAQDLERDVEMVRGQLLQREGDLHSIRQDCFQEECEALRLQRELGEVVSLPSRLEAPPRYHGLHGGQAVQARR